MRLKYPFYFKHINNTWVGIVTGEHFREYNGMLRLNDMGYDVVKHMIDTDFTEDSITRLIMDEYEGSRDEVDTVVRQVIDQLHDNELLC